MIRKKSIDFCIFHTLQTAADNGNLDMCRLIIEKVDNKNPVSNNGDTPLHKAAKFGHLEICRLIIANITIIHPLNKDGRTPRNFAEQYHHVEISKLFES